MKSKILTITMTLFYFNLFVSNAIKMGSKRFSVPRVDLTRFMSSTIDPLLVSEPSNGDVLITALNGPQDIMVKVVTCREIMQEQILKNDLSPQAGKALGEVMVSTLMMGSGLKGEESLQV
jgi:hypothetical protein